MFRAIFTNSFGILFSRVLGFIRDLLTASILGANIYSDIFFVAFKLPNLFRRIFAEGAFTQSFLPAFTKSKHKGVFSVAIFLRLSALILLLTLFVNLFAPFATKAIALGFSDKLISLAAPYVALNFWYLFFIFATTFLAALLQYKQHFATTAFATALLNLSMIVALLLFHDKSPKEIVWALSWGVVFGGALQLIVHIIALYKLNLAPLLYGGIKYFHKKSSKVFHEIQNFKKQFLPAILGNSTAQLSAFLDTWLASFLAAGSISYLYYANRVFQLPLALFAIATSIALFPKISRYLKHNDTQKALLMLQKAFWFLAYLLTLSSIVGAILSYEIIWLLFERGNFSAHDTKASATILAIYLLGLLPYGVAKLFSLWLYAQEMQKRAAKIASYTLLSNIVLSLLFITPLKAAGLALASTISGYLLLFLTLQFFGLKEFIKLLRSKHSLILPLLAILFAIIALTIKSAIRNYFDLPF